MDPDELLACSLLERGLVTREQLLVCAKAAGAELSERIERCLPPSAGDATVIRGTGAQSVAPAATRPGRYDIRGQLGHGGLGAVLLAFDPAIGREVALKVMRTDVPGAQVDRFLNEGRITGQLEHPNIVPVYESGTMTTAEGPRVYFTMKRITGRNLREVLRGVAEGAPGTRESWPLRRLLAAFLDVCEAVAFAHSRGVLHRDLKPANVMVGEFGETLVVDWGLAKVRGAPDVAGGGAGVRSASGSSTVLPSMTLDGEILGTPAYMPPEQAEGRLDEIDERSDVYSLGAILYEMLALCAPFSGSSALEILEAVSQGRLVPPSERTARRDAGLEPCPADLESICLRAMSVAAAARHPSALALREDVNRFLEGTLERERRRGEALGAAAEGTREAGRWRATGREIEEAVAQEEGLSKGLPPHRSFADREPVRAARRRVQALRERRIGEQVQAMAAFHRALSADAECESAREGLCSLFHAQFLEAEKAGDRGGMLFCRKSLASYDKQGDWGRRLDAPGRLTVRAFARDCACLRPVSDRRWRVEFDEETRIPWRDGRPLPGEPATPEDRPVTAIRTSPAELRFGHTDQCLRREVDGAEIEAVPLERGDLRSTPGAARRLGLTPLLDVELPQGSWMGTVRAPGFPPHQFPFRIDRDGTWTQELNLYRQEEIPPGFCVVPRGPFLLGGHQPSDADPVEATTRDLFVARFPLTFREWREFLNDLAADGRIEDARRRAARTTSGPLFEERDGRFHLLPAVPDEGLPVAGINARDALVYLSWKSTREGRVYRPLHEVEFEKAARGVDGREYPWGDGFDPSFANTRTSFEGPPHASLPGAFPGDVSVYGVLDLGANVATLCWNSPEEPFRHWIALRGGSFAHDHLAARPARRSGAMPESVADHFGLRVACDPYAWPDPGDRPKV